MRLVAGPAGPGRTASISIEGGTRTMSHPMNRRQMLLATGAALLAPLPSARACAAEEKKVLFFTKSSGFQHSVITRKGDKLGHAEQILTEIGKEHGFEVVASKDGRLFDPDKIGQWDAFVFETTGDLTTPGTDKTAADVGGGQEGVPRRHPRRARASSACTAPPTPSATTARRGDDRPLHPDDRRRVHRPRRPAGVRDRRRRPRFPGVKAFGTGSSRSTTSGTP